jgi:flagellar hook-length control protein FliK
VSLALGPDARLDLTLDPVELGRVEVAIERQGKEAVVSLRAERPETLALLQRDRAELERALSDAGLRNAEGGGPSLSFGLGGEGAARQERRAPSQRQAPAPQRPEPAPQAIAPRGLLDLAF